MADAKDQALEAAPTAQRPVSLLRSLSRKASEREIPIHTMLELTNLCNLKCRHCYITEHSRNGELQLDEYRDIMDQLAAVGVLFLTLSGGEPMTREDFFRIAAMAREKEFSFTLYTNGTLITPEAADQLRDLCPERVEISILGSGPSTHDLITQVPGSFDKALQAAKLLIEREIRVQLKTALMRENLDEAWDIQSLAAGIGATYRSSFPIIHRRDGSRDPTDLMATPDQWRAFAKKQYERIPGARVPPEPSPLSAEQTKDATPCGAARNTCRIDSRGNVYPCPANNTAAGNLRRRPFADVWKNSEELTQIRAIHVSDIEECASCRLLLQCNRCSALAKMETGSLLKASPQACMVAHAFEGFYQEKRCELD